MSRDTPKTIFKLNILFWSIPENSRVVENQLYSVNGFFVTMSGCQ